jgi:hypothetical protein
MTVLLRHLDVHELTGSAGGDPWQRNKTIQSGSPGEISELATAFYEAGVCTQDTSDEFNVAKQRFESAWDRQDGGDHPINDSEEVRRATESLHLNRDQMGRIAVDLQNISASLAEAQRSGDISIDNLETRLRPIDDQIDREITAAAANGQEVDWSELKQAAIDATEQALQEVQAVRDAYSQQLDASRLEMAAEGYTPDSTAASDGEGGEPTNEQAHADADKYEANQRAADQGLVNSPDHGRQRNKLLPDAYAITRPSTIPPPMSTKCAMPGIGSTTITCRSSPGRCPPTLFSVATHALGRRPGFRCNNCWSRPTPSQANRR